jgi:PAS domain S-box-containing protein
MSPDLLRLITFLEPRRDALVSALLDAIATRLPVYSSMDPGELLPAIRLLVDDLLSLLARGDTRSIGVHLNATAARRVDQAVPLADYIEAHLQVVPAITQLLEAEGLGADPGHHRALGELSRVLLQLVPVVARAFTAHLDHRISMKNQELQRLGQRLAAYESREAEQDLERALDHANEFNRRVLESLSSGLMVVDSSEQARITLVSSRMEEILGIAAEELQGEPITSIGHIFTGIDLLGAVRSVRTVGRMPLTRVVITRPDGRKRAILAKASRMFDAQGKPEGTVVVADDVTERELLLDSFSRYVSGDLVRKLLARGESIGLEGERQVCTILFADIRGFTGLAEENPPEVLHRLINTYFRVMIDSITSHHGFIDKFVGDQIMAIFNSHHDPGRDALAACNAALEIQARIALVNKRRADAGEPPLHVGIGLNTGEVLLGNIGSEARMDFTAIGDAVNVAARLQGMARQHPILIGEGTAEAQRRHPVRDLGVQSLKGRRAPERIFALER